jgi:hypothetical protein
LRGVLGRGFRLRQFDRQARDVARQRLRLQADLEHGRTDHEHAFGAQPHGAKLDLAPLAQDFGFQRQRLERHRTHQIDRDARDPHRRGRRHRFRGPDHKRRRRRAVLHGRVPGTGGTRADNDAIAVDAKNSFHQLKSRPRRTQSP